MPLLPLMLALFAIASDPAVRPGISRPDETLDPPAPRRIAASALCARGDALLDDGSRSALMEARRLFEAAIEGRPEEACGHAGLSRALVALSVRRIEPDDAIIDRALEAARHAARLAPDAAVSHASLAGALLLDLQPDAADTAADMALALDAGSIPSLQTFALVQVARGRLSEARDAIERALARAPGIPLTHHILGTIHLLAGRRSEALDAYGDALTLSPEHLPSRIQIAACYEEMHDYGRSGRIMRELLDDHPEESARLRLLMAHSVMERGGWQEALAMLGSIEMKTRRGLGDGTVLHLKALCLEQLGRDEEARTAFRRVIDEYPDATAGYVSPQRLAYLAYEGLMRLHLRDGNAEAAVSLLEEGASRPDPPPGMLLHLARIYEDYALADRALAVLERAADREFSSRTAGAQTGAYVHWARLGRHRNDEESLRRLSDSLNARGPGLEALQDYVWMLEAVRALSIAGRGPLALQWLERAVGLGYRHLAWIADDPEMASLRGAPGFAALAASAAVTPAPSD